MVVSERLQIVFRVIDRLFLSDRKVKYLNMKGSLADKHTIKTINANGKEVRLCK